MFVPFPTLFIAPLSPVEMPDWVRGALRRMRNRGGMPGAMRAERRPERPQEQTVQRAPAQRQSQPRNTVRGQSSFLHPLDHVLLGDPGLSFAAVDYSLIERSHSGTNFSFLNAHSTDASSVGHGGSSTGDMTPPQSLRLPSSPHRVRMVASSKSLRAEAAAAAFVRSVEQLAPTTPQSRLKESLPPSFSLEQEGSTMLSTPLSTPRTGHNFASVSTPRQDIDRDFAPVFPRMAASTSGRARKPSTSTGTHSRGLSLASVSRSFDFSRRRDDMSLNLSFSKRPFNNGTFGSRSGKSFMTRSFSTRSGGTFGDAEYTEKTYADIDIIASMARNFVESASPMRGPNMNHNEDRRDMTCDTDGHIEAYMTCEEHDDPDESQTSQYIDVDSYDDEFTHGRSCPCALCEATDYRSTHIDLVEIEKGIVLKAAAKSAHRGARVYGRKGSDASARRAALRLSEQRMLDHMDAVLRLSEDSMKPNRRKQGSWRSNESRVLQPRISQDSQSRDSQRLANGELDWLVPAIRVHNTPHHTPKTNKRKIRSKLYTDQPPMPTSVSGTSFGSETPSVPFPGNGSPRPPIRSLAP